MDCDWVYMHGIAIRIHPVVPKAVENLYIGKAR